MHDIVIGLLINKVELGLDIHTKLQIWPITKFITPHARHSGRDKEILKNREKVYKKAKRRNPDRWTGNIRNWDLIEKVDLNPDTEKMIDKKKAA